MSGFSKFGYKIVINTVSSTVGGVLAGLLLLPFTSDKLPNAAGMGSYPLSVDYYYPAATSRAHACSLPGTVYVPQVEWMCQTHPVNNPHA